MTYRTHKEQTRMIMAAGFAVTLAIVLLSILALTGAGALATCSAVQSSDTCAYALR